MRSWTRWTRGGAAECSESWQVKRYSCGRVFDHVGLGFILNSGIELTKEMMESILRVRPVFDVGLLNVIE